VNTTAISVGHPHKPDHNPNCDACGAALPALTATLKRVCGYCGTSFISEQGGRALAAARTRATVLKVFLAFKIMALVGGVASAVGAAASYLLAGAFMALLVVGYAIAFVLIQVVAPMM